MSLTNRKNMHGNPNSEASDDNKLIFHTAQRLSTTTQHDDSARRRVQDGAGIRRSMPKVALADNHTTTARQPQQQQQPLTQQPQPNQPVQRHHNDGFILLQKNARSLCTVDAIDELLSELQHTRWHIVTINETWRTDKREFWTTKHDKHVFAGAGHDSPTRGVAFLVHKCIAGGIQNFTRVDERIAYLDININSWKLRIITAYFPHTGYTDAAVQHVYDILSTITSEARAQNLHVILAGDFNAQVGRRDENDTNKTLGKFALEPRNSRGEWLTSWAASHRLI